MILIQSICFICFKMKQIPTQHQTNKPNDDSGEETGAKVREGGAEHGNKKQRRWYLQLKIIETILPCVHCSLSYYLSLIQALIWSSGMEILMYLQINSCFPLRYCYILLLHYCYWLYAGYYRFYMYVQLCTTVVDGTVLPGVLCWCLRLFVNTSLSVSRCYRCRNISTRW